MNKEETHIAISTDILSSSVYLQRLEPKTASEEPLKRFEEVIIHLYRQTKELQKEVERLKLEAKILLNGIGNGTLQIKEYQKDLDDAKLHIESYKAEAKENKERIKEWEIIGKYFLDGLEDVAEGSGEKQTYQDELKKLLNQ